MYRPSLSIPRIKGWWSSSSGREMLGDLGPQEGERPGHLVHAVHAVLDADPAVIAVGGEDAEDGVVVVQPLAGDAVAEVRRVAERAVGLLQFLQGRPLGEVAV